MSDPEKAIFRSALLSLRLIVKGLQSVAADAEKTIEMALLALDRNEETTPH